jgi:hypothetical protein
LYFLNVFKKLKAILIYPESDVDNIEKDGGYKKYMNCPSFALSCFSLSCDKLSWLFC